MNARDDQTPFSLSEFVAASIAMAAVVVIAFQGIWGAREANLSAGNLSRSRPASAAGRSLQVSPWRLDNSAANAVPRPGRPSDVVTVRKVETFGPAGSPAGRRPAATPPSTFFAESAPATVVEMQLPDIGGPPPPLIGPRDLFHMPNAIPAAPVKPTKEATIPPRPERKENR
jgi:hypothetical protein